MSGCSLTLTVRRSNRQRTCTAAFSAPCDAIHSRNAPRPTHRRADSRHWVCVAVRSVSEQQRHRSRRTHRHTRTRRHSLSGHHDRDRPGIVTPTVRLHALHGLVGGWNQVRLVARYNNRWKTWRTRCISAGRQARDRRRTPGHRSAIAPRRGLRIALRTRVSSLARGEEPALVRYTSAFTASATSAACPSGFTFSNTRAIRPFWSMTKVVRNTPMYFLPYIDFSAQTPYASHTA